jgi:type IV secretory pathway VirB6-like protein
MKLCAKRSLIKVLMSGILLLMSMPSLVHAGTPTSGAPPAANPAAGIGRTMGDTIGEMYTQVLSGIKAKRSASTDPAARQLKEMGTRLAWGLFLVMLAWSTIKTLFKQENLGHWLGEALPLCVMMAITTSLMSEPVLTGIDGTFQKIAEVLNPGGASGLGALNALFKGAENVTGRLSNYASGSWYEVASNVLNILICAIGTLVVWVLLAVVGALFITQLLFSEVMMTLAFVLAPVMIPWALWQQAEFIFQGWIKFFLSASMIKVIVAFVSSITVAILESLMRVTPTNTGFAGDLLAYGLAICVALVAGLLMMRVTDIATSLIPGGSRVGYSGWKSMTGGAMGAALGGSKNVAAGAASGASRAGASAAGSLSNSMANSTNPRIALAGKAMQRFGQAGQNVKTSMHRAAAGSHGKRSNGTWKQGADLEKAAREKGGEYARNRAMGAGGVAAVREGASLAKDGAVGGYRVAKQFAKDIKSGWDAGKKP